MPSSPTVTKNGLLSPVAIGVPVVCAALPTVLTSNRLRSRPMTANQRAVRRRTTRPNSTTRSLQRSKTIPGEAQRGHHGGPRGWLAEPGRVAPSHALTSVRGHGHVGLAAPAARIASFCYGWRDAQLCWAEFP